MRWLIGLFAGFVAFFVSAFFLRNLAEGKPPYDFVCGAIVPLCIGVAVMLAVARAMWVDYSPTGKCESCGYDLTGNTSGTCPECGTRIKRWQPRR